jgi:hypothetical protein
MNEQALEAVRMFEKAMGNFVFLACPYISLMLVFENVAIIDVSNALDCSITV